MKLGIMQPYFFPYIGYWQLMNAVDKYVIYDDVNFIKGGWINRNRILMNGQPKMINLQMQGASPNKLINEVETAGNEILNRKLLRSLESAYKKAPYYNEIIEILEDIINQPKKSLSEYIAYSIKEVCKYLDIKTEIIISSTINKNNELKGQDKVIHICKLLNADEYYNAIGGQELYSFEDFKNNGIELSFLKTNNINYKQFSNEFVPNLSIIDVMMFNSKASIKEMLFDYELVKER